MTRREYNRLMKIQAEQDAIQMARIHKLSIPARILMLARTCVGVFVLALLILVAVKAIWTDAEFPGLGEALFYMSLPGAAFYFLWYITEGLRSEKRKQQDKEYLPQCTDDMIDLIKLFSFLILGMVALWYLGVFLLWLYTSTTFGIPIFIVSCFIIFFLFII